MPSMIMRRHIALFELFRLEAILLESRLDFLQKLFLPKLAAAFLARTLTVPDTLAAALGLPPGERMSSRARQPAAADQFAAKCFAYVVARDPDTTKKHVQWLLTLILRKTNPMPLEDLEHAGEALTKFMAMKQARALPADKTDINTYKSLSDLNLVLRGEQQHAANALVSQEQAMLAQCDVLYDGADYRVLSLLTKAAACYFGCDTEWCTAWGAPNCRHPGRTNMFDDYIKRGPLYYVLAKASQQKFQLSFGADQYMDANDSAINLVQFFAAHPKVAQIFAKLDGKPIAELNGGVVYAQGRGFMVKSASGPAGKVMLTATVDADGVLHGLTGRWAANRNSNTAAAYLNEKAESFAARLGQLFTQLTITGDPKGEPVCGELYYRDGRWGTLRDVAKRVLRVGEMEWRQVKVRTYRELLLVDAAGVEYLNAIVSQGVFDVVAVAHTHLYAEGPSYRRRTNTHPLSPPVSHAITAFLLIDKTVTAWNKDALVKPGGLTPDDVARLIAAKPGLGDLSTLFRVQGASAEVKTLLVEWCRAESLDMTGDWQGDKLVIERFKDVGAMIAACGDHGAQWFYKILEGDDAFEIHDVTAETRNIEGFIRALPAATLSALGHYLRDKYVDDADDIAEYDPADASTVCELAAQMDDGEVQQAADWAMQDGLQIGAQNEMYEMFWNAIKQHDAIVFVDPAGAPAEAQHDTACWFVLPIDTIMAYIGQHGLDEAAATIGNAGFAAAFEAKIALSEPRYGFSGYDEAVAQERFDALVDEFLSADDALIPDD